MKREIKALFARRFPHADWIAKILESAAPQMPQAIVYEMRWKLLRMSRVE